jgi:crotonobetainyl-CoA:carnitine CoA-transferase CaiB-like acyl-CoA transferase
MGHVIAGAGIGRSLASLGADVLNVWRATEFEEDPLIATANVGVRSTRLDVRDPDGQATLRALLREADIFYANRRPGLLTELGVDAEQAFAVRPGLIHVTASCHGETGPWARRVGFDQVAGTVTGMVAADLPGRHGEHHAVPDPAPLPERALPARRRPADVAAQAPEARRGRTAQDTPEVAPKPTGQHLNYRSGGVR